MNMSLNDNLIYAYCVTSHPFTPTDEPVELKCLEFNGLYCIVKEVSPDEYNYENLRKNFSDLRWIEAGARDHIRVICDVMKDHPVIPFKFSSVFNTIESLEKFIIGYYDSLTAKMNEIQGKEEWSVKIYCNKDILNRNIEENDKEVRKLEEQIIQSTPGKAFILGRKKADLISNQAEEAIRKYGQMCYDDLAGCCVSERIGNLMAREVTGHDDDMILNAAFFVSDVGVDQFTRTAEQLQEKLRDIGLTLEITGPWPPFNFVSIKE